ncbi:cytoplasmic polyadenylation element-binding protein 3-like [Varroa jacobsoni]|nr:cytoplasmic polyadenylation element-binding protein 3-like [Varroa jacobsoni]
MATLVQPRIIWVERNFELTREPEPNPEYSRKIFIGGFPPQVTSRELEAAFQPFGRVRCHKQADRGHAYVVFENGRRVAEFLSSCRRTEGAEIYAWQAWGTSLQVIPWETSDNQYGERILDLGVDQLNFMVFVGALYGETTAKQLAFVLELTCGPVQFVRIDTDRYQYPTGSARVQFRTYQSFLQALKIHYLEIRAHHYQRTIELNPFVDEGVLCSRCLSNPSVVVCKAATCLKHYCNRCFMEHVTPLTDEHIPVIRREQGP